eukprot:6486388-Karenia_brevis.AAC.1
MAMHTDGSLTGNAEDMEKLVSAAWMPIFRKYVGVSEPCFDNFEQRFGSYVKSHVCKAEPITGQELRMILNRMSSSSARGPDGWAVTELKCLPI